MTYRSDVDMVKGIQNMFQDDLEDANHHSVNDFSQWPGSVIRDLFEIVRLYHTEISKEPGDVAVKKLWKSMARDYLDFDVFDDYTSDRLDSAMGRTSRW